MATCFVYKVIRDLESIDHLFINSIRRSVQVNVLLNNCKQNISSLSLLVGTTVESNICALVLLNLSNLFRKSIGPV